MALFDDFIVRATGKAPYDYQRRLALQGLPELLKVPTGAGKTQAAVLSWLFRRRLHSDPAVRSSTPHWLIFVLPMRVLVEQTYDAAQGWLNNLGLRGEVGLHQVMGGEGRLESRWRLVPEQDAIFIGTLDMLLSRALNRGYGVTRFAWPIDFGLFNAGTQWVFDEIQLMGPALPTSRQLEGLRRQMGTAMPCRSMWMSATVDDAALCTVDAPDIAGTEELRPQDFEGPLAERLGATKTIQRLDAGDAKTYARSLAGSLAEAHRTGTLTLAILNTVARARAVHAELTKLTAVAPILLHSRFRPDDRRRQVDTALAAVDPSGPGRIVISTQVVEAGVDISAATLLTEAAPWPSVVQRAGRCNRDGQTVGARLLWVTPPNPVPYSEADVGAAADALCSLQGQSVTAPGLAGRKVMVTPRVPPVLRRRDLVGLFDTAPDLSGNDVDVGRFIREADDLDVLVAWRSLPSSGPNAHELPPTRRELCPVPIADLRAELKARPPRHIWRYDHLTEAWVSCTSPADLRPGATLLLRAEEGGYTAATGWDPLSKEPVSALGAEQESPLAPSVEATGADPLSRTPGRWVPLRQHLDDVLRAARELGEALGTGLSRAHLEAASQAAALHDWGKIHPIFQASLISAATPDDRELASTGGPWAKSPRRASPYTRKHFRHELASALAIESAWDAVLGTTEEPDLVCYLVGAHHGRVRLAIRSLPGEARPPDGRRAALGVWEGDELPAWDGDGLGLPAVVLDLASMELGMSAGTRPSWAARALALRDRGDLGMFRLGFLEALVRLADWRASAAEEQ